MKNLLLDLEQVVQVDHKIWTVRPATSKHHLLSQDGNGKEGELGDAAREVVNNLHIPYVARPSHQQLPHTGGVYISDGELNVHVHKQQCYAYIMYTLTSTLLVQCTHKRQQSSMPGNSYMYIIVISHIHDQCGLILIEWRYH